MPRIFFSHANSFGLYTYQRIIQSLEQADCSVSGVEQFGHDSRYPVSNNWRHLLEQLHDHIECSLTTSHTNVQGNESDNGVYLIGHSLGGYLSVLCAAHFPRIGGHKIDGVILLDAPLLGGWKAKMVAASKRLGMIERISPARISRNRRNHWESPEQAKAHFLSKPLFQRWHASVLQDYIEGGLVARPYPEGQNRNLALADIAAKDGHVGFNLRFLREVESDIYNTLADNLETVLRRNPLQCPLAFVQGTQSHEVRQVGLGLTHRVVAQDVRGKLYDIEGSHLFPMEKPDETVQIILDCLRYWQRT